MYFLFHFTCRAPPPLRAGFDSETQGRGALPIRQRRARGRGPLGQAERVGQALLAWHTADERAGWWALLLLLQLAFVEQTWRLASAADCSVAKRGLVAIADHSHFHFIHFAQTKTFICTSTVITFGIQLRYSILLITKPTRTYVK